jgi:hypothetical protein
MFTDVYLCFRDEMVYNYCTWFGMRQDLPKQQGQHILQTVINLLTNRLK